MGEETVNAEGSGAGNELAKPRSSFLGFAFGAGFAVLSMVAVAVGVMIWQDRDRGTSDPRIDQDFLSLGMAVDLYGRQNGGPPTTGQGLQALVERPPDMAVPERWVQLLSSVPQDPWGKEYGYRSPGRDGAKWEILSAGKDGEWDTKDDLVSGEK
jgi:general secretion pathway protein G